MLGRFFFIYMRHWFNIILMIDFFLLDLLLVNQQFLFHDEHIPCIITMTYTCMNILTFLELCILFVFADLRFFHCFSVLFMVYNCYVVVFFN